MKREIQFISSYPSLPTSRNICRLEEKILCLLVCIVQREERDAHVFLVSLPNVDTLMVVQVPDELVEVKKQASSGWHAACPAHIHKTPQIGIESWC